MDDLLNWRASLLDTTRTRHVYDLFRLLDTQNSPSDDEDKSVEFHIIAQSVERKIYADATSQADYVQKLSRRKASIADTIGWRTQLQPDSRHRVVLNIKEKLCTYFPPTNFKAEDGLRIFSEAMEESVYIYATSQSQYHRLISINVLSLGETARAISEQPNGDGTDSGSSSSNRERSRKRPIWMKDYHMAF